MQWIVVFPHFKAVVAFQQTHTAVSLSNSQILIWWLNDFQQVQESLQSVSFKELAYTRLFTQLKTDPAIH